MSSAHLWLTLATVSLLTVSTAPARQPDQIDSADEPELELEEDDEKKSRHDILVFRRAYVWRPTLDGTTSLENSDGFATEIEFDTDLGLGDTQSELALDVNIRLGQHDIRVNYFQFRVGSTEVLTVPLEFGDISLNPGDVVDSDFEARNYKIIHGFSPFNLEDHGFRLGTLIGLNLYDIEASITDVAGRTNDSIDETIPLPVIGAFVEVPIWHFLLAAEASGFALSVSDVDAIYLDASISLAWRPLPLVGVLGGYRLTNVDLTADDFDLDAQLQGWFVGGEIRF